MCDYCQLWAVFRAYAWNGIEGATRLACRQHHDRAREACSAYGIPTITELHQRTPRD